MLIGLFGFAAGTALFNSVLYAGIGGLLIGLPLWFTLLAARFVHASVMSAAMPAANAYMADITSIANRTKGMGAAGAATNVGTILGPAVCMLSVIDMLTPLWVMAGFAFLNGLFVLRFLPKSPHIQISAEVKPMRFTDPRILPFMIVGVVMFVGFAVVQQTMGFRFQDVLNLDAQATTATFAGGITLLASCSLSYAAGLAA